MTLYSPTHLMLITGASLSTFGALALYRESLEESDETVAVPARAGWLLAPLTGAMLIGLNTFLAEFDFAVPQFRLDVHPVGIAMAAGIALVSARLVIGPFGALATVGFFLLLRGTIFLIVGPGFGHTEPRFPLYLAAAVVVELVAVLLLRSGRPLGRAPGALRRDLRRADRHRRASPPSGAGRTRGSSTRGRRACSRRPRCSRFVMAVAAGTIGGFVGRALTLRGTRLAPAPYWALPVAALAAVAAARGRDPDLGGRRLDARDAAAVRHVAGPRRRAPRRGDRRSCSRADAADDARWLTMTSWQGKAPSVVQRLRAHGPGRVPHHRAGAGRRRVEDHLRLHRGNEVLSVPVFLPEDPAIPAKEVPATPAIDRAFVLDKKNLQREQKQGVSGVITTVAFVGVGLIALALFAILFWGLRRVRATLGHDEPADNPPFAPSDRFKRTPAQETARTS